MRTQQYDLYASERGVQDGPVFASVADVQVWLDDLRDTWWWERWLTDSVKRVEVGIGRPGPGVAGVGWYERPKLAGRMEFARGAELNERRLVHELSHVIASARRDSKSHDPWFARVYLELTYLIRGSDRYLELRQAFDAHGIDYEAGGIT